MSTTPTKMLIGLIFAVVSCIDAKTLDIFDYFTRADSLRQSSEDFALDTRQHNFRFLDSSRSSLGSTDTASLRFLEFPVQEARVFFSGEGVRRAEISIFNRGDSQTAPSRQEFETLVDEVKSALSARFGKGSTEKLAKIDHGKYAAHVQWKNQSPVFQLDWAFGNAGHDYRAEFLRITIAPKGRTDAEDNANLTGQSLIRKPKSYAKLSKSVVRDSRGDVIIENLPMVDQGQKGYCAAATTERVLRHYGLEVDQHQIAQLAETSAVNGTGAQSFIDAVERIGKAYRLTIKRIIKPDDGKSFTDSQTFADLREYNKTAKRIGSTLINWESYASDGIVRVTEIWEDMDPRILLLSRKNQRQAFARFKAEITSHVDRGIPLFWACLVGIYPEVPHLETNGIFGHLRLIIGYNRKTDEIIYSDSWGAGHEIKRMRSEQAWAMTKYLLAIVPRM